MCKFLNLSSLFFVFFSTAYAQEFRMKKSLLERMVQPKVMLESAYLDDAKVNGSDGSVAVVKNRIRVNNKIGGISYTNWSFLWNNIGALPFGDGIRKPIEQMHSVKINGSIPYFINDNWFFLASLSVNTSFEKEMDDSYGVGIFTFASYKINDDHSLQMGAFANYHPVSTLALPVISYSYRARKRDGFQLVLGFPRAYAGYSISENTLLRSGMIFSQSVIKLADTSPIEASGYIEAEDYMANIGLSHELTPSFRVEGDLLYSIKRNFIIYDSAAQEQESHSINPSFGLNIRIRYLF